MKKNPTLFYAAVLIFITSINATTAQETSTIKDLDGNVYKIVKIGTQTWMAENLKTVKFNDGTPIPLITDKNLWSTSMKPAYCWYENDTTYKNSYGALYNGFAVNSTKLCPAGWHVSTDAEWKTLTDFLGGIKIAGGKMKETGNNNWKDGNSGATNESKFNALPGGTRFSNGLFFTIKTAGYWWTFNGTNALNGWYWNIISSASTVNRYFHDSTNGFSVRCVKD
jgi:uncharacterized protein (TIGR02145 family)